jgi:NAD(P)H-hydrate epimerase
MRIYSKAQIRSWDSNTINQEPISSIDLMERASNVFCNWFESIYIDKTIPIDVFAGFGNNGGDALAIARILSEKQYHIRVFLAHFGKKLSSDCQVNLDRLNRLNIEIKDLKTSSLTTNIDPEAVIIDGLFGSGLSRKLENQYAELVESLNALDNEIVAIDIPSGLDADTGIIGPTINSTRTLSFQIPKFSFFLNEVSPFTGNWDYRDIGLDPSFHLSNSTGNFASLRSDIVSKLRPRSSNSDKADFGFGQLCGGSPGMLGAILLAGEAAFRVGIGRLIISTLKIHHQTIFANLPVSMVQFLDDYNTNELSHFERGNSQINAFACGPGMGTQDAAIQYLDQLLSANIDKLILDADALNIIAKMNWQKRLPKGSIITPHFREFQRLFGNVTSHYDALQVQKKNSAALEINIILKGPNTSISNASGELYFNTSGNVGMATAGSGDVLTGMLLGLIAQEYELEEATKIACYVHGLAGDLAKAKYGVVSMLATDIIEFIPEAIKNLYEN